MITYNIFVMERGHPIEVNALGRESGILELLDQTVAQELYNLAIKAGGRLGLARQEGAITVVVKSSRRGPASMKVDWYGPEIGYVSVNLRRGKKGWQDNGAKGYHGVFGELSKAEPEPFRPSLEQRDEVLRRAHGMYSPRLI